MRAPTLALSALSVFALTACCTAQERPTPPPVEAAPAPAEATEAPPPAPLPGMEAARVKGPSAVEIQLPSAPQAALVPFTVRFGPFQFRNGCEGVGEAKAVVGEGEVRLVMIPRAVAPDAMCTMALHSQWAEVELDLPEGKWRFVGPEGASAELEVFTP